MAVKGNNEPELQDESMMTEANNQGTNSDVGEDWEVDIDIASSYPNGNLNLTREKLIQQKSTAPTSFLNR